MKTVVFLTCLCLAPLSFCQTMFKLDSLHQFSWSESTMQWRHNTREIYSYDNGGGKETHILRLSSGDNGNSWANFYQFIKTYNGLNNITENKQQTWDTGVWKDASKHDYTYNGGNQVATLSYSIFSAPNWLLFDRHTYQYGVSGNRIEDLLEERNFSTMMLENSERWTYSYNILDQKIQDIKVIWFAGSVWQNDTRKDYIYNSSDLLLRIEELTWTRSDTWAKLKQTLFEYNADNLAETITNQTFGGGMWVNTNRTLQAYAGFNLGESVLQEWNTASMMWDNNSRWLNTYNIDDNLTEQILQIWNNVTSIWDNNLRILRFWSVERALSVSFNEKDINTVVKNPFKERIQISFNRPTQEIQEAILFDIYGKKLKNHWVKPGSSTFEFDVFGLNNAAYILHLNTASGRKVYIN